MGLGISPENLLVQLINFAILLALFYFFGYKRVLNMLDRRSARIKESMETAEQIQERAAHAQEEVKAKLDEARKEGQQLVNQARQIGERFKEEARQEARQEAESIISRARQEIQQERDAAIEELRHEFADLAILAAEKVIEQSLDKKAHQQLIDKVLEEISSLKKG